MPRRLESVRPAGSVARAIDRLDLAQHAIRNGFRKRVTAQLDYRWRNGRSAPPTQIDLKVVDACNLRCHMCAQWGEQGYNFTRPSAEIRQTLPLEVYRRLVDDVRPARPWIYIHGGEPFLYPDLMPLLRHIKRNKLTVTVVTNGTRLKRHVPELVAMGTDVLMFSLDGPREIHDRIRGLQGAFDETLAGIEAVLAERRRAGRAKPYVVINSVITGENQTDLEKIFDTGEQLGIDMMLMHYGWFQTEESGKRYSSVLGKSLRIEPWSWKGWLWDVTEIDPATVVESVRGLRARNWSFRYHMIPALKDDQVEPYYRDHGNTFGASRCVAPWTLAEVMPNGDVVSCRDYPDVVVGNITEKSILEIWNDHGLREFRNVLKDEGGLIGVCSRCPGLMGM